MEEKKVKIEVSRLALVFIILFGLSLLIWSFVIGVWVGTKIEKKAQKEEIVLEQPVPSQAPSTPPVVLSNETTPPPAPSVSNETTPPAPVKISPPPSSEKPVKEEIAKKEVPVEQKKKAKYQKKEVAKIATQIKEIPTVFYSVQIGAFSKKEIAEKLKDNAISKGYKAFMKEYKTNGEILYKVYVGKYSTKEEAKKYITQIAKDLNVEHPFVTEIK
ncbi:Sporulation domain-containing protein [Thermodesulfobacterium geofontis OPF15]|uniref:Sporulation domain-containing protein n=1 Tax=Thermodesulfobacterium geofontis (strain OPF15) TaxID=795359 RepID=F8C526_THEGP|nr:SPOR domain-containing protein [Thermodesulfobacterium geofontis]AEH23605.1 Sporulation domain-containing protein [Thermodesulfobacterium geofontis OPF15]